VRRQTPLIWLGHVCDRFTLNHRRGRGREIRAPHIFENREELSIFSCHEARALLFELQFFELADAGRTARFGERKSSDPVAESASFIFERALESDVKPAHS